MNLLRMLLPYLMSRSVKGGFSNALLQGLLMRGLRRNPLGLIGTFLLQKALAGDGRLFGMDLASRRKARMAWLAGLVRGAAHSELVMGRRDAVARECPGHPARPRLRARKSSSLADARLLGGPHKAGHDTIGKFCVTLPRTPHFGGDHSVTRATLVSPV